jgi:hypothetical protein
MKLRILLTISGIAMISALGAAPAHAQATRTWVSGVGDDVNPCSRTAPCKTFAGAISKTAAGGEIDCLDPGGFGTVTITKSITIDCTGTFGSILASGTNGVNVNDSASGFPNTIRVVLRGLTINGAGGGAQNASGNPGTGLVGINFSSGASLIVQDVLIQNFNTSSAAGISFRPSASGTLAVLNSQIVDNGTGTTGGGIVINPSGGSGTARATISNVELIGNAGAGVSINSTGNTGPSTQVTITNSRLGRNGIGLSVLSPVGTTGLTAEVDSSNIFSNTTGIKSDGGTIQIGVSDTTIMANSSGLVSANGGTIQSWGDNRLIGNAVPGAFNPPALVKQ